MRVAVAHPVRAETLAMFNTYLAEEMARDRHQEALRASAHERLLAENGLDLWSAVLRWLRGKARAVGVAKAADPVGAAHGALARRPYLVQPQPARAGSDEGNAAA